MWGGDAVSYYPAMFFIMSAVYLAPHVNTWVGIVFGAVLACVGWYALFTEEKNSV